MGTAIFTMMFIVYELYKIYTSKRQASIIVAVNDFKLNNWGNYPPPSFYYELGAEKLMVAIQAFDMIYFGYITYLLFSPLYRIAGFLIWLQVVIMFIVSKILRAFDKATVENYQRSIVVDSILSIVILVVFVLLI
jgi:hypothetical protein